MKVENWVEVEERMSNLMGWKKALDEMVDAKREVSPGTAIYDLSAREDTVLLYKLRKRYERFKESRDTDLNGYETISS